MKKNYLLAYNLIAFLGWLAFLVYGLVTGFQLDSTALLLLNISQGMAILEVLHAQIRWVSSPPLTTALQVGSRIFILFLINLLPSDAYLELLGITGLHMVWIAWGLTEIVRYSFYFLGLLGKEINGLTFLRYSLFLALYPLGVTGEILILFSYINLNGWDISLINGVLFIIFIAYFLFFPKMYGHMLRQRRKKLVVQ